MRQKILTIFVLSLSISACVAQDNMIKIPLDIDGIEMYTREGDNLCLDELSGWVTILLCIDETGIDKYFIIFNISLYKNSKTVLKYHHPPFDSTFPYFGTVPMLIEDFPEDVQYYYPFIAEYVSNLKINILNKEKLNTRSIYLRIKVR